MSRVWGLTVAFIAVLAVLAAPALARAAATPVIDSVSAPDRHPTVTWSLPEGVEAEAVEVADKPDIGEYDQFVSSSVWIGEQVDASATSWTSLSTRLDPGTYYVHVLGWDQSCMDDDFATECEHVVSPTVTLVVTNAPPRLGPVHIRVWGRTVHAKFTLCDDAAGTATVVLRERRKMSGRTLARFSRGLRLETHAGCDTYTIVSKREVSLGGRGKHSVTLQVLDYDGAYSNVVLGQRSPPT